MAVGCCFVSRAVVGRRSTSEVAAERLTPQPAPFAKIKAPDIIKEGSSPFSSLCHFSFPEFSDF